MIASGQRGQSNTLILNSAAINKTEEIRIISTLKYFRDIDKRLLQGVNLSSYEANVLHRDHYGNILVKLVQFSPKQENTFVTKEYKYLINKIIIVWQ